MEIAYAIAVEALVVAVAAIVRVARAALVIAQLDAMVLLLFGLRKLGCTAKESSSEKLGAALLLGVKVPIIVCFVSDRFFGNVFVPRGCCISGVRGVALAPLGQIGTCNCGFLLLGCVGSDEV